MLRHCKLIIGIIIFLTINSTLAGGPEKPADYGFNGFWVGADIGVAHGTFHGNQSALVGNTLSTDERNYLYDSAFTGGIQLGYGWQWNRGYFGLYAQGHLFELTDKQQFFFFNLSNTPFLTRIAQVKLVSSAAIGIKPGILLSPTTLLFLQIAASYTRAHLNSVTFGGSGQGSGSAATNLIKNIVAPRFGIGIEQKLSQHLSLLINYTYTYYGHIEGVGESRYTNFESAEYSLGNNLILIGLNYYPSPSLNSFNEVNQAHPFRGFLVGIFGGYHQLNMNETLGETGTVAAAPILGRAILTKLVSQNAVGGILVAYNFNWNWFVLGFEAENNLGIRYKTDFDSHLQLSAPTANLIQSSLTEQDYIGITVNPGFLLNENTLLFTKFGLVYSYFKYVFDVFTRAPALITVTANQFSHGMTRLGFRFGLGIEHKITHHISLYLLDQYTLYRGNTFEDASVDVTAIGEIAENFHSNIKPNNNQILIGANYYFSS